MRKAAMPSLPHALALSAVVNRGLLGEVPLDDAERPALLLLEELE